ncbi:MULTISPECIES: tetratricopeptide repeat protein [Spirulina sp. CCY15215]|uniref:tetratricopeptide repeat protein n=1 Tax=Spirulina sp. CCY15215 TaxID=2767591 RepID=UPI00194F9615
MLKRNWLLSALAIAGSWQLAAPVFAQALLPYTFNVDANDFEQNGAILVQDVVQLVRFEQYGLALPRAKLATQLAPNLFESWFILGSLYIQQQELDRGIEVLLKAQKLAPEESGILFTLGSAYFQKGQYEEALEVLETGLSINPESTEALFDLGNTYLMLQRYPKAIASYEVAFAQQKEFWPAVNNIGLVKYEQGDTEEAIAKWRSALAVAPEAVEPKLAIAVALYTRGEQERAWQLGEEALSLDRKYAELDFLKENLWGERLLADAASFLATPRIQELVSR